MESLQVLPDRLRFLPHISTGSMLTPAAKETREAKIMSVVRVGVRLVSFGTRAGGHDVRVTARESGCVRPPCSSSQAAVGAHSGIRRLSTERPSAVDAAARDLTHGPSRLSSSHT